MGDLTLTLGGDGAQLKLSSNNGSRENPILPVLIDAKLVTMHSDKMLFRGVERGEDASEYVQEWSVMVTSRNG
jgi:hypothetical protein